MKNKVVIGLFVVAILVAGVGELVASRKQPAPVVVLPQPIVTTTQPSPTPTPPAVVQTTPPSPTLQRECNLSQGNISTSTWKTFFDPQWEIKFQYPSDWKVLEEDNRYMVSLLGHGYSIIVHKDFGREMLEGGGTYTPCHRTIADKSVLVFEDPYAYVSSTRPDLALISHVFGINERVHEYAFFIESPLSSTKDIANAFINSIQNLTN